MNFQTTEKIKYDPYHIISQRRKHNRNKSFEHHVVEGPYKIVNLLSFEWNQQETKEVGAGQESLLTPVVQKGAKLDFSNKKNISEVSSMDIDEEVSNNMINMGQKKDIVVMEEQGLISS